MESSSFLLLVIVCFAVLAHIAPEIEAKDPTDGFISLPLKSSNFNIQRPYNLPVHSRYRFANGVHKLWVYSTDKPHNPQSHTLPRTEVRIKGYDYKSGVWQFEGQFFVPNGSTGVSIMQIKDYDGTTLMLRVYNGALLHYPNAQVLAEHIYQKWIRVNVIHDTTAGQIKVFLDGSLKLVEKDRGSESAHYFKFGVYTQKFSSHFMESLWRGIKVLKLQD